VISAVRCVESDERLLDQNKFLQADILFWSAVLGHRTPKKRCDNDQTVPQLNRGKSERPYALEVKTGGENK
jgi:hypothetical protein